MSTTPFVSYVVPDPVEVDYAVPFGFLRDGHLRVTVDGVPTSGFIVSPSKDSIEIVTPTLLPGDVVVIRRVTPLTPLVTFADASTLRREDLQTSQLQLLYLLQEAGTGGGGVGGSGLQLDPTDSKWDALTRILKNLGDPVADQDAATKGWVESAFATGGVLPAPSLATALFTPRVNQAGTAYVLTPSQQEEVLLQVIPQTTSVVGQGLGFLLHPAGDFSNAATRCPLQVTNKFNDTGAVSLAANTFDITLAAGQWVIHLEFTLRGLTDSAQVNSTNGQIALTDTSGVVTASTATVLTGTSTIPMSSVARVEIHLNLAVTTTFNVRGRGSTSSHRVVADVPSQVRIRRVVR